MQVSSLPSIRIAGVAAAVAAALSLAACDKPGDPTVGQRVDTAIADAKQAGQDAKKAGDQATETVKAGAMDATITTKINAALAVDDKLSAMKIDVDTVDGKVTLKGTAPDVASRSRASTLTSAVNGVKSVDNQLRVKGS